MSKYLEARKTTVIQHLCFDASIVPGPVLGAAEREKYRPISRFPSPGGLARALTSKKRKQLGVMNTGGGQPRQTGRQTSARTGSLAKLQSPTGQMGILHFT